MWNTSRYEQKSAVLNLDHPLGEDAELHVDANFTQGDSAFRYAPSVGLFPFTPNPELLQAINDAAREAGSDFAADDNDWFVVAHRFVGHGNRDWRWDTDEYDVSASLEGRLAEGLGYDARISAYRLDGFMDGDTFVHEGRIASEIWAGNYDLEDPFSRDPEHLRAIRDSSLRLENDFGGDSLEARLALEGSGFAIGGRDAAWTAGFELGSVDVHDITDYRSNDGMTFRVSEVLGSGGFSYTGERTTAAALCGDVPAAGREPGSQVRGASGRIRRRGGDGVVAPRGRLSAERRRHAAQLLERRRQGALDAVSLQLRVSGPPLHRVRPGTREPAPLVHGAQPATGDRA